MARLTRFFAILAVLALIASACGDDDTTTTTAADAGDTTTTEAMVDETTTSEAMVDETTTTAEAAAGETFYNANCIACHGDPATDHDGLNGGQPNGSLLAYLANDGKFSEFAHKARWGIPDTIMDRSTMGSPTSQNIADVMLYLQQLGGTGFAINPGLSGHWWGARHAPVRDS